MLTNIITMLAFGALPLLTAVFAIVNVIWLAERFVRWPLEKREWREGLSQQMRDHAEAAKITAASLGAELRKVNEKNVQLDREAAECHNEWERLRRWSEELKAEQVKHCARVNKRHPQTGNNVIHLNGGEGDAA